MTPLVLRVDGERLLQGLERFRVSPLIELYPAVEFESGRRLGIFAKRLRSDFLGLGNVPGVEKFFALLEFGFDFGGIQVERRQR